MDYYLLDFSHEKMDKAFHVYVFMHEDEYLDFMKYQKRLDLSYIIDDNFVTAEIELELLGCKRASRNSYDELHEFIEDEWFANNLAKQMTQLWIEDGCD
jgi:hypothetical protein